MQTASLTRHKRSAGEIVIKIFDKNGRLIKVHRQKMHSIVSQVAEYFYDVLGGASVTSPTIWALSATNLTSPSTVTGYPIGLSLNGPFPQGIVLGHGIVGGTAAAAVLADALASPYYYGSSPNQMIYGSPTITLSQSSSSSTISVTQIIRNPTSSSETVSELALIAEYIMTSSMSSVTPTINSSSPYTLLVYDVISPTITVPSLGSLQVTVSINFD